MVPVLVVAWCLLVGAARGDDDSLKVPLLHQEVPEGSTATLPCLSAADGQHQFQFWMLDDDSIIGPTAKLDADKRNKYKYEVLSGNLTIQSASHSDSGLYRCVSKGWNTPSFTINHINLVVQKDWEEVWANDTGVNLLRGVLAVTVIVVCCAIGCVLFRLRRSGYLKSEDLSDDEAMDEESPYQSTTRRASQGSNVEINVLETELPRTLNSMYRMN